MPTNETLQQAIQEARTALLADRGGERFWNFGAHLGAHFLSQYFLMLKWYGREEAAFDVKRHRDALANSQLADGSWYQVQDESFDSGDLNATVFNYWALKAMGENPTEPMMSKARAFILAQGGIDKTVLFTKTFLSLFGNYDWRNLTYIPYITFVEGLPSNYRSFAQWVIPHLIPMAYLRHIRASKVLGERFKVDELWIGSAPKVPRLQRSTFALHEKPMVEKILEHQQPRGSWGGYTVSTLLAIASLTHFLKNSKSVDAKLKSRIEAAIMRGFEFVDWLYLEPGPGVYQGALMDGRYWDSLLVANALADATSGEASKDEALTQFAKDVHALRQVNGGYPYGIDFEYAPDVDDTAEAVLYLSRWPGFEASTRKSIEWLRSMQNSDGGWGAFDRENVGNPFLRKLAAKYSDSVDLFDDSSADSTGHVLDALSVGGLTIANCDESRKGVRYLFETQHSDGPWVGRWAINYLFGTTCALVGLLKAGEAVTNPKIQKAFAWLETKQNSDGGFGESTKSYDDFAWSGRGPSTPSQTAWVLWALIAGGKHQGEAAKKAADYLLATMTPEKTWVDRSVTGTGHPGLLYMNYPSYARAFPLIALAQYEHALRS